jgi:uncharacterized protein YjcR
VSYENNLQESEKQCQFIYTAELCEEKDFENVSIHVPHLSVQNKTARVQQKKESKLIKTKQSFHKSPDTHENLPLALGIPSTHTYIPSMCVGHE